MLINASEARKRSVREIELSKENQFKGHKEKLEEVIDAIEKGISNGQLSCECFIEKEYRDYISYKLDQAGYNHRLHYSTFLISWVK